MVHQESVDYHQSRASCCKLQVRQSICSEVEFSLLGQLRALRIHCILNMMFLGPIEATESALSFWRSHGSVSFSTFTTSILDYKVLLLEATKEL